MEYPMVSVIIPVFGVERYLNQCVQSVVNQTYSNLEIILVDDGSKDHCPAMCDTWAGKDPRVRAVHQANGGVSQARNAGIGLSGGELISFVDADDYLHEDFFSTLVLLLLSHDADISVCRDRSVSENGERPPDQRGKFPKIMAFERADALRELLYQNRYDISPCAKVYRSGLFGRVRFPAGKVYGEDLGTVYKAFGASRKTVWTDREMYYYRSRPGSAVQTPFHSRKLDCLDFAEELLEYVEAYFPGARGAAAARALSAYCHILIQLPEDRGYGPLKARIYGRVKELRKGLLADGNVRLKNKAACLASYFGEPGFLFVMRKLSRWNT